MKQTITALILSAAFQTAAASSLDAFTEGQDETGTETVPWTEGGRMFARALAAGVAGGVSAGISNSTYRSSYTTKYSYDRNGQLGRVSNRHYDSRVRYNRDGSIREIKTRWK